MVSTIKSPSPAFKFAAAGVALIGLSGCTAMQVLDKETCMETEQTSFLFMGSASTKYNRDCGLENSARQMINTDDPGLKAVGYGVLEQMHGPLQKEHEELRAKLLKELSDKANKKVSQSMECTIQSVKSEDGQSQFVLGNCRPK